MQVQASVNKPFPLTITVSEDHGQTVDLTHGETAQHNASSRVTITNESI